MASRSMTWAYTFKSRQQRPPMNRKTDTVSLALASALATTLAGRSRLRPTMEPGALSQGDLHDHRHSVGQRIPGSPSPFTLPAFACLEAAIALG